MSIFPMCWLGVRKTFLVAICEIYHEGCYLDFWLGKPSVEHDLKGESECKNSHGAMIA
jgi:hypothetical protein